MTHRLILGTVQFGLPYGINNFRGQVPPGEVAEILRVAWNAGVRGLDTSEAYGDAQRVVGECLRARPLAFGIVSKLARGPAHGVPQRIEAMLAQLGARRLYGLLCHHFESYSEQPGIWAHFQQARVDGRAERIGFSLYHPRELETLLESGEDFDLVQVPYNVLDRRFERLLPACAARGIEVHARSIFLQGLLHRPPEQLGAHFSGVREKIARLREVADSHGVTVGRLLVSHALAQPGLDKVVIGVDSTRQLQDNLEWARDAQSLETAAGELAGLQESDEKILLPTRWPK